MNNLIKVLLVFYFLCTSSNALVLGEEVNTDDIHNNTPTIPQNEEEKMYISSLSTGPLASLSNEIWTHTFSLMENHLNTMKGVCSTWCYLIEYELQHRKIHDVFSSYTSISHKIINLNTLSMEQKNKLIKQHDLYIEMFILDLQGNEAKAQQLLNFHFPKLKFTNYIAILDLDSKTTFSAAMKKHDARYNVKEVLTHYHIQNTFMASMKADYINKMLNLRDQLMEQRDFNMIKGMLSMLAKGGPIHTSADIKACHELCDKLIAEGGELEAYALKFKIKGLDEGINGFAQDSKAARELVENQFAKRTKKGILWKIEGLTQGKFGFARHEHYARKIIESLKLENNPIGDFLEIEGMIKGKFGFSKNLAAAKNILKPLVRQGNKQAFDLYLVYLFEKMQNALQYNDEKNNKICTWINNLVLERNTHAINFKLKSLIDGKSCFQPNETLTMRFIEEQCQDGHYVAKICKAMGLGYGLYGFSQDKNAAINFVQREKIHPYILQSNFDIL